MPSTMPRPRTASNVERMTTLAFTNSTGLSGLGLGLPTTTSNTNLAAPAKSPLRVRSVPCIKVSYETALFSPDSTIEDMAMEAVISKPADFDFPMPPVATRNIPSIQMDVSYWSPPSPIISELASDSDSPAMSTPESVSETVELSSVESSPVEKASPAPTTRSLAAHPCLHLLSPKAEALARAASETGVDTSSALDTAIDFGWIMPLVESGTPSAAEDIESPLPSPASMISTVSIASSSPSDQDMSRTQSIMSAFSTSSAMTACTSVSGQSTKESIVSRKRPVQSAAGPANYFGGSRAAPQTRRTIGRRGSSQILSSAASSSSLASTSSSPAAQLSSQLRSVQSMFQIRETIEEAGPIRKSPTLSHRSARSSPRVPAPSSTRQDLLRLWAEAENAQKGPQVPLLQEKKSFGVLKWLGGLKHKKSAVKVSPAMMDVKEPAVRRTRSIEKMLDL